MATETGNDAFSASEEAFFQSVPPPDHGLPSERPVTLEEEPFVTARTRPPELEARRARFMRPVRLTLAALGALTLVGLTRSALTHDSITAASAHPATPSEATVAHVPTRGETSAMAAIPSETAAAALKGESTSAVAPPRQIMVEAESEDPPALLMSTAANSSSSLLDEATAADSETPEAHTDEPPVPPAGAAPGGTEPKASESRRAHHASFATRPAPITKAGLLSAIRASRPAHSAQKTL